MRDQIEKSSYITWGSDNDIEGEEERNMIGGLVVLVPSHVPNLYFLTLLVTYNPQHHHNSPITASFLPEQFNATMQGGYDVDDFLALMGAFLDDFLKPCLGLTFLD